MLLALALFAFGALQEPEPESELPLLAPGQDAPAWSAKDWLSPSAAAPDPTCTVLAFWAPWNAASLSTLPYLSRLQLRFREAPFSVIAVTQPDAHQTTRESAAQTLANFDEEILCGAVWDAEGAAFAAFARASGNLSMPVAVVIDRAQRVAWIGHPLLLDLPVARVLAGTWDYASGPKETLDLNREFLEIARMSAPKLPAEEAEQALVLLDAFAERCPERARDLAEARYQLLHSAGRAAEAHAQGLQVVETARVERDARTLNSLAWSIANPDAVRVQRDLALALYAATCAAQLTRWQDPWSLDTLAAVHWSLGDRARAITVQREALTAAAGHAKLEESLSRKLVRYESAH